MDVSVIIVTYDSAPCIRECLASVRMQERVEVQLIVVDNASADDTLEAVRDFGAGIRLIQNRENAGFGKACNQGFAASQGRLVYLLNPDAQLVRSDGLALLNRALADHPRWGMAATRILSADSKPRPAPETDYPGQSPLDEKFSRLPGEIAWVIGASMIVRREVYAELGGFDPDFFLYGEDMDFCLRLRRRGHEIGLVEEVAVRHIGGASEQGRDPYEVWTRRTNGIHQFWKKHYAAPDVGRLVRQDQRRARFRMLMNGLFARFQPPRSRLWQKHRRYRAIWETSARFLAAR